MINFSSKNSLKNHKMWSKLWGSPQTHFKLELDSFIFPLSLNWTFTHNFGSYGYFD